MYFLGCKGLSNDDIEVARRTVVQEIQAEAGFKTGVFAKGKVGEATVERFLIRAAFCLPHKPVTEWLAATPCQTNSWPKSLFFSLR